MTKRNQIIQTTIQLVSEMGLYATSMALIIKESKVSAGTIYHYFKNKDDLIRTIYDELREEMGKILTQGVDQDLSFKNQFFMFWKNLFFFFRKNPHKFEFIEHYASTPLAKEEVKVINQSHYQSALDFIQYGIEMGYLRNLPVEYIIQLIFAHVSVVVRMISVNEEEPPERMLQAYIQSSWDSIRNT
ncbi:MAG: TetR/AcrR family transcriptional regulator [Bacteroidales bacterium]|jgi:AcrR family transcriptional regulator|nr:TetR/AcrR family transcriptional regulator [Bacteroidales bacterium]